VEPAVRDKAGKLGRPRPGALAAAEPALPSWAAGETPLWRGSLKQMGRLGRRARASWPIWVLLALVGSVAVTVLRVRRPPVYAVNVVLRLVEGAVTPSGAQLSDGALRAQVRDLALSSARLTELMRRHVAAFPQVTTDPTAAVEGIRGSIEMAISDDDFIEDRGPGDPPRQARLTVTFRSLDPELAFAMAHEIADVLVGSAIDRERQEAEREQAAAALVQQQMTAELGRAAIDPDPDSAFRRAETARARLAQANTRGAAAALTARALKERQALRFDIADPGRVPSRQDPRLAWVTSFPITLLLWVLVAGLLAGAFDPRVIVYDDLTALGLALIGEVPPLPPDQERRVPAEIVAEPGEEVDASV
jgi:hypothetical protein